MSHSQQKTSKAVIAVVTAVILVVTVDVSAVLEDAGVPHQRSESTQATKADAKKVFIVQMAEEPVATYQGGDSRFAATKPKTGQKIDSGSQAVTSYSAHLKSQHARILAQSKGGEILYDYVHSFNGFAAKLSPEQAQSLASQPGVLRVTPDKTHRMHTATTPSFLGLGSRKVKPRGLWNRLGGKFEAGKNVVIAVLDTGIWPESLSFADRFNTKTKEWTFTTGARSKIRYAAPKNWQGRCDLVDASCNRKLIGARYYNAGWGGDEAIKTKFPEEFLSPRDANGHGTHVASTAGGNPDVKATGPFAATFGNLRLSGMAPHAYVAAYKIFWGNRGKTSDIIAASDQAVEDGADVINYSGGSGPASVLDDPLEIAFLNAAKAGVFVATSAGNNGPEVSTTDHPSPWVTTVAAGTHNRVAKGAAILGSQTFEGASYADQTVTAPVILATAAGILGADPDEVRLCYQANAEGKPVLDPQKVAGKIVVCDRGVIARVDKSLAVKQAGGVGMILVNTAADELAADFHSVPTVHLPDTDALAVKGYAAQPGVVATIKKAEITYDAPAPFTADFSSRGPLLAGAGDLLKPDLIAPGQDILAAMSPKPNGRDFDSLSGTSMSSPHVAGLGALLRHLHPAWSPMAIKSALMTSGIDVLDGPRTDPKVIFSQGAGHVRPNSAADPGLVYDAGVNDWNAFLCGSSKLVNPNVCADLKKRGYSFDISDMNVASIAIGDLPSKQTVKRTVTNVGPRERYRFSYEGLAGFKVQPSMDSFEVKKGESLSYSVDFNRDSASFDQYSGGYITWTGHRGHIVRIPVVINPVLISAPQQVSGRYEVKFGYDGSFAAQPKGLTPATMNGGQVSDEDTVTYTVNIPSGIRLARFSLFDRHVSAASDLDLLVFKDGVRVGVSGGSTAEERVDLIGPEPGNYTVEVYGYTTGNPSTFTLFNWLVSDSDQGNMQVSAPTTAAKATSGPIEMTFTSLDKGLKYLGLVDYQVPDGLPKPTPTVVFVER